MTPTGTWECNVEPGEAPCGLWEGASPADWSGDITQTSVASILGYTRWLRLQNGCSWQMRLFSSEDFPTVSRLGARAPWWRGPMLPQCLTAAACVSRVFRSVGDVRPKCLFSWMNSKQSAFLHSPCFPESLWLPSVSFCPSLIALSDTEVCVTLSPGTPRGAWSFPSPAASSHII